MNHRRLTFLAAVSCTPWLAAQAHWTRLYPSNSPAARLEAAMAFDATRGVTSLFSGSLLPGGLLSEHWLFDGTTWQQVPSSVVLPPPRTLGAMCFDAGRDVLVLFGGNGPNGQLQDTWEWNGTTWSPRSTTGPSPRYGVALAYDPQRAQTVLFGGIGSGNTVYGDTWEWNGSQWSQRSPQHAPSPRQSTALAFDPQRGGILLFGGAASGLPPMDDTWRWDGSDWQQLQPANLPYGRSYHRMVTDTRRGRVLVLGGNTAGGANDPFAWEWDGDTWHVQLLSSPSPRAGHALAYDELRRGVVLFGGSNTTNDTWRFATDLPADYAPLGQGCGGSLGEPVLDNLGYSWPWTGDTFTARVSAVPPGTATFFATGLPSPQPIPLDPYGLIGCQLHAQAPVAELRIATGAGVATWSLAIPNAAALGGVQLAQQVFVLDPLSPHGVSLSNARRLEVGVR